MTVAHATPATVTARAQARRRSSRQSHSNSAAAAITTTSSPVTRARIARPAHTPTSTAPRGRLPSGVQHRQRGEQGREGRGDVDAVEVTEPDDEGVEQPEQRGEHARRDAEQPAGKERDQPTGRGRFEDRHDARGEQVRLQPATCGVMTDELLAHRVPARALPRGPARDVRLSEQQRGRGQHLAERWVLRRAAQIVAGERGQAGGDLGAFVVGRTVGPRLVQREHQEERGRHAEERDRPALRNRHAPAWACPSRIRFGNAATPKIVSQKSTRETVVPTPEPTIHRRVSRWSTRAWA